MFSVQADTVTTRQGRHAQARINATKLAAPHPCRPGAVRQYAPRLGAQNVACSHACVTYVFKQRPTPQFMFFHCRSHGSAYGNDSSSFWNLVLRKAPWSCDMTYMRGSAFTGARPLAIVGCRASPLTMVRAGRLIRAGTRVLSGRETLDGRRQ